MHFCYVDESGDSQPVLHSRDDKQPMLVVTGIFVDAGAISAITKKFIALKRRFYPKQFTNTAHDLNVLLTEIKGSDIRKAIRSNPPGSEIVQHHFRFLDGVFALCKSHDVSLVSRIWVKPFGQAIDDEPVYTITVQNIAKRFEKFLQAKGSRGAMIADFRDPKRNKYVAHSIFTQKHKKTGDAYPSIEETAVFGMSDNHACLQINDLLCSAVITPMAGHIVCSPYIKNVHTHSAYAAICNRYMKRLRAMQFHCRYENEMYWGITVRDPHNHLKSLFPKPAPKLPAKPAPDKDSEATAA